MTRANVNIATLYSSAQCVLSVVGSVGVILLFAGIPQLIYSPVVSVANLMTFLLGAILITTMVAGNSFLNYKYRKYTRAAQQGQRDSNSTEAASSRVHADDKPPSYDTILSSDGLPPDYYSIIAEKPPRYEDIATGIYTVGTITPAVPLESTATTDTSGFSSCDRDSPDMVGLDSLPVVLHTEGFQPKDISIDTARETQVPSILKKADEEAPPATPPSSSSSSLTQVTIGYDNDAFSSQEDNTSSGGSSSTDLRESES